MGTEDFRAGHRPTHTLKEGLQLEDLNKGVELEFDPEADLYYDVDCRAAFKESAELYENSRHRLLFSHLDHLSPFESLINEMEPVEGNEFVYKKLYRSGEGPVVPQNSLVTFHVNLYLEFSDEPFDSSRLRGHPNKMIIGQRRVIAGLEHGILSMKKGESATYIIKSEAAFGAQGAPPRIPTDANIFAEVEILDFSNCKIEIEFEAMDNNQKKNVPYEVFEKVVETYKSFGNDYMKKKKYFTALQKYVQAARLFESYLCKDSKETVKVKAHLVKLYLNMSIANFKLDDAKKSLVFSKKAMDLDENNVKALFRCGKAHLLLSEFKQAKICYEKALKLEPHSRDLLMAMQELSRKEADLLAAEKKMFKKMMD